LKTRIVSGFLGNGHRFTVLRNPSRNALPNAEFEAVDDVGMRILRRPEHEFIAFENVDEAGVALDQCRSKFNDAVQNFVKAVPCTEAFADFVQYIYV
jgi:hypothetical protein